MSRFEKLRQICFMKIEMIPGIFSRRSYFIDLLRSLIFRLSSSDIQESTNIKKNGIVVEFICSLKIF